MSETATVSIPPELIELEADARARLAEIERATLEAEADAALRAREDLRGALRAILTTAGLPCLMEYIELPADPVAECEGGLVLTVRLPEHAPICLRLVPRHEGGWEPGFWRAQPDDPLAPHDTQPLWRVRAHGSYSYCVHFGTALVRARRATFAPDDEIPF